MKIQYLYRAKEENRPLDSLCFSFLKGPSNWMLQTGGNELPVVFKLYSSPGN